MTEEHDYTAARAVWIKAAFEYGGQSIPGEGEERAARVIADYVADHIAAERIDAARMALEAAAERCADYMFDCIEDLDVFKNWPHTRARNEVYAGLIRAIDPAQFAGRNE